MAVIQTEGLIKEFGRTRVLDTITLTVNQGEIYGFLGLNGAGKTTLIRTLLGMIKPSSGKVFLFGKELTISFNRWNDIGYLVETPYSYPNLTVVENLEVYYKLRGLKNRSLIDEIIDRLKLEKFRRKKAKVLSLGNQQRLGLAKALMHKPQLLILDEPVNGLDPEGIVEVRELLKELADTGTTVFISSHILNEISKISDRIGIIHNGKLIKELTDAELEKQLIKKVLVQTSDDVKALEVLTAAGYSAQSGKEEIEIPDFLAIESPEKIAELLVKSGIPPRKLVTFTEDLEMFFLRTIKN